MLHYRFLEIINKYIKNTNKQSNQWHAALDVSVTIKPLNESDREVPYYPVLLYVTLTEGK